MRRITLSLGLVGMLAAGGAVWAQQAATARQPPPLDQQQRIVQVLSRLTWGIAPGDEIGRAHV